MIVERARVLRAKIEQMASELTDEVALEFKEFFPQWVVGHIYTIGSRCRDEGKLYKCLQWHTSQIDWKPSVTPNLWDEVSIEEWPPWKPTTGSTNLYMKGDKVSHNNKHWISDYDNNSWEPGVFGWHEATE